MGSIFYDPEQKSPSPSGPWSALLAVVTRICHPCLSPMSWVRSVTYVAGPDNWTNGDPGRIRTCDLQLRRLLLYPLSYGAVIPQSIYGFRHNGAQ